jgi:hypothetical protein
MMLVVALKANVTTISAITQRTPLTYHYASLKSSVRKIMVFYQKVVLTVLYKN